MIALAWPVAAGAQGRTSLAAGPLLAIQPAGYGNASPYLDHGVGGAQPGLALALERRTGGNILLALELSSTRSLRATQSGRLVFPQSGAPCGPFSGSGCGPVEARQRDTLVSALVGRRFRLGRGGLEPKAGASFIVGKPKQAAFTIEGAAGRVALTAGIDAAFPLGDRVELVPSLRYSRALRGDNDFYVGLGADIVRVGLFVRLRL